MVQANKFMKVKNILDLQHQRYINYFNICAISFVSITFSIVWSTILEKIPVGFFYAAFGFETAVFAFLLLLLKRKIASILTSVANL